MMNFFNRKAAESKSSCMLESDPSSKEGKIISAVRKELFPHETFSRAASFRGNCLNLLREQGHKYPDTVCMLWQKSKGDFRQLHLVRLRELSGESMAGGNWTGVLLYGRVMPYSGNGQLLSSSEDSEDLNPKRVVERVNADPPDSDSVGEFFLATPQTMDLILEMIQVRQNLQHLTCGCQLVSTVLCRQRHHQHQLMLILVLLSVHHFPWLLHR